MASIDMRPNGAYRARWQADTYLWVHAYRTWAPTSGERRDLLVPSDPDIDTR